MKQPEVVQRQLVEREAARCAGAMFHELTGGRPRPETWYAWFLCERHGGPPLLDAAMPRRQVAYWDGEDIVLDACASLAEIADALPEELIHRLCSRETPRFEPLNATLRHAPTVGRAAFQEMVGQQVAALFAAARWEGNEP